LARRPDNWVRLRSPRRANVPKPAGPSCIYVLAGTNGAGKSSIGGAAFRERGADYFNPDEASRAIRDKNPGIALEQANSAAWFEGKRLLERAIRERLDFAFETTLGGHTIAALLETAMAAGIEVRIWYAGLDSAELHIARVRARVAKGGHDIPESKIRERYEQSRLNLIRLMPALAELRIYDNSEEADPEAGAAPEPRLILHMRGAAIVQSCELEKVPEWSKPLMAVAIRIAGTRLK
jgi:predicted ABC-type ATPase